MVLFNYFEKKLIIMWLFIVAGFFLWFYQSFTKYLDFKIGGSFITLARILAGTLFAWAYVVRKKMRG